MAEQAMQHRSVAAAQSPARPEPLARTALPPRAAALQATEQGLNGGPRVAQLRAWSSTLGARSSHPAPVQPHLRGGGESVIQTVSNPALMVLEAREEDPATKDFESADFAGRSLSQSSDFASAALEASAASAASATPARMRPPVGAFIVNAILPYTEVGRIPKVVEAMLEGRRDGQDGRVGVVLGINAPSDRAEELAAAMKAAEALIEPVPVPVGLIQSTFPAGKKFPYGTMRNAVMHSPETRLLTQYFTARGLHPYISFQDFDTGSRLAGSDKGPHVFDAVEDLLSGLESGEDFDEGMIAPIRPLMIAGGYRPGSQDALVDATLARVEQETKSQQKDETDSTTAMTREDVEKGLADFPGLIHKDMEARDKYAKLEPLLPYAPEPNLFLDATAAMLPSPVSKTRLGFSPDGAEFTGLGKGVGLYAAEELQRHYGQRLEKGGDKDSLEAELRIHAETNRHPIRGKSVVADFQGLSVATDLSRLARGYLKGTEPQSHTSLAQVTDRFFDTKSAKKGASFADIRDSFRGEEDPVEFMNSLYVQKGGVRPRSSSKYFNDNATKLGGRKKQRMSGALQQPFPNQGPFSGLYYGTSPDQAVFFANQVALQNQREEAWLKHQQLELAKNQALRDSVQVEAQRIGVTRDFRIGVADGRDHNCTIISIFAAAGIPINRDQAVGYRQRLWHDLPKVGLTGDIDLDAAVATRILAFVEERGGRAHQLNTLEEVPQDEGGGYRSVQLAGGGTPIYIFFHGAHFSPATPL